MADHKLYPSYLIYRLWSAIDQTGFLMIEESSVVTKDGVRLSTTVISPTMEARGVIQFHAGTVIRKEYYLKFGRYLAEQGYVVVLFDYRGVGGSRPVSLRGYEASISDWGIKDGSAVLSWIRSTYPQLPVHLFAHSMGGQILGLMDNWHLFDKLIVVASSSGNWHNFKPSYRRKIRLSSNLFFPITLRLYDFVPGRFGLGQDWPRGVAEDWWRNSQEDSLMADFMQRKLGSTHFKDVNKKIHAFWLSDDHMATPKTIPNYQKSYPNAKVITRLITPDEYGFESIGHFGLFKEWSKGQLWEDVLSPLL